MKEGGARLGVLVDGVPLPDDEAREVWDAFSAYMEEHRGDLGGFARTRGFASAHPRSEGGRAILALSHAAPQEPYGGTAKPVDPRSRPQGESPKRRRR